MTIPPSWSPGRSGPAPAGTAARWRAPVRDGEPGTAAFRSFLSALPQGGGQPDVVLGGQPCIGYAFVHGSKIQENVRSGYWWAGVVSGRGVQVTVAGTKSIIDLDQARRLRDLVTPVWSG